VQIAERDRTQVLPAGVTDLPFAGHNVTGAQLLASVERALAALGHAPPQGKPWAHVDLPWTLFRIASPFVPLWRALLELRALWTLPNALDGQALLQHTGPLPGTPLDAAVQATVQGLIGVHRAPVRRAVA
jgi:hypothetical protein